MILKEPLQVKTWALVIFKTPPRVILIEPELQTTILNNYYNHVKFTK